jgi:hypothetical protein
VGGQVCSTTLGGYKLTTSQRHARLEQDDLRYNINESIERARGDGNALDCGIPFHRSQRKENGGSGWKDDTGDGECSSAIRTQLQFIAETHADTSAGT